MKILLISGSPRAEDGATEVLTNNLAGLLRRNKAEVSKIVAMNHVGRYDDVQSVDVLVLVFPIRFDALPAHVMQLLLDIERYCKRSNVGPVVYVVANTTFYEAKRCKHALAIARNWVHRNGASWGGGIALGGCLMLGQSDNVPSKCLKALMPFAKRIAAVKSKYSYQEHRLSNRDIYVNPSIPRFLYVMTTYMRWKQLAEKNKTKLGRAY